MVISHCNNMAASVQSHKMSIKVEWKNYWRFIRPSRNVSLVTLLTQSSVHCVE